MGSSSEPPPRAGHPTEGRSWVFEPPLGLHTQNRLNPTDLATLEPNLDTMRVSWGFGENIANHPARGVARALVLLFDNEDRRARGHVLAGSGVERHDPKLSTTDLGRRLRLRTIVYLLFPKFASNARVRPWKPELS